MELVLANEEYDDYCSTNEYFFLTLDRVGTLGAEFLELDLLDRLLIALWICLSDSGSLMNIFLMLSSRFFLLMIYSSATEVGLTYSYFRLYGG